MGYIANFIQESKLGGSFEVNYMDLDSMVNIDGFEILPNNWDSSLVQGKNIRGVTFRYRNNESQSKRREFVNEYIPYHSEPSALLNNPGSPLFRLRSGIRELRDGYLMGACSYAEGTSRISITNGYGFHNFESEYTYTSNPLGTGFEPTCYLTTSSMGLYTEGDFFNYLAIIYAKYQGEYYLGVLGINATDGYDWVLTAGNLLNMSDMVVDELEEYDEEFGEPSEPGGYGGSVGGGNFDHSSDHIGFPANPSISISAQGFLNVYKTSGSDLDGLVNEIMPEQELPDIPEWSETFGLPEIAKYLSVGINSVNIAIKNFFNNNLLKYVIDIHAIPVRPTGGSRENIHCGVRTLSSTATKLSDDYVDFDFGTLSIKECYKNFVDYVGTKCECFLPGVGFVPIKPELFQDGKIQVKYKFNIIDGSFVACIISTSSKSKLSDSVVGQYSGTMCVHMPISSSDYASLASGIASGVTALGGALTASPGVSMASASNAVSAIANIANQTTYNMSNGFTATAGYSGCREAYLKISRQVPNFARSYQHENGLPLNVTRRLSTLSGFTVCDRPHLDGLHATESEKRAIYDLLTNGVIL